MLSERRQRRTPAKNSPKNSTVRAVEAFAKLDVFFRHVVYERRLMRAERTEQKKAKRPKSL